MKTNILKKTRITTFTIYMEVLENIRTKYGKQVGIDRMGIELKSCGHLRSLTLWINNTLYELIHPSGNS